MAVLELSKQGVAVKEIVRRTGHSRGSCPVRTASGRFCGDCVSPPVPGQEIGQAALWRIGDTGEHFCEPSLGIDVVELRGGNHRVHDGGAVIAD